MTYFRHNLKPATGGHVKATSLMGKSGLDLKDLPEFMNPAFALKNENYFVMNNRGLSKRSGLTKLTEIAGTHPITMAEYWKGYIIFGYNTTVAAYNVSTKAVTTIKSDWATSADFSGAPYGDYFFVGNTGNKINYITETGGVFSITEITGAPMSSVIKAIGPRLYAGVGTDVYYSSVDDGTNPPFQTWTVATLATSGGKVSFRNAGTINSICSLGDIVVAFGDTGKWAFRITTQNDGSGTIVKLDEVVIDRIDMGGASGAITTPRGLFYVNKAGLWQLVSLGQSNVPFSDQEGLTSVNLGTEYFKDVSLDNIDIVYYDRFSTILVTCAKQSTQNNHIVAYNTDMKAFSTFRNWNINRWVSINSEIYGGSSVKTALYKCFSGTSDDGVAISTSYLQEIKLGDPWVCQMFYGMYIKGLLHSLSEVDIGFNIYDRNGVFEQDKLKYKWTAGVNYNKSDGWGIAEWGKSAWGGDVDFSDLVESFGGAHKFIRNFTRIQISLSESSKLPHQIDWFVLDSRPKVETRRRNLVLQS